MADRKNRVLDADLEEIQRLSEFRDLNIQVKEAIVNQCFTDFHNYWSMVRSMNTFLFLSVIIYDMIANTSRSYILPCRTFMERKIRLGLGRSIKWKYTLVDDIPWKPRSSRFLIQNKIGEAFIILKLIQKVGS